MIMTISTNSSIATTIYYWSKHFTFTILLRFFKRNSFKIITIIFWLRCMACGILVPWPQTERDPCPESAKFNHWITIFLHSWNNVWATSISSILFLNKLILRVVTWLGSRSQSCEVSIQGSCRNQMQGGGLIWILMRTLTNKMDETMEKSELWLCILILDMIIA